MPFNLKHTGDSPVMLVVISLFIKEKEMALVVISIDRDDLPKHTDKQFEEWVKYEVGHSASLPIDNPMTDRNIDGYVREIG